MAGRSRSVVLALGGIACVVGGWLMLGRVQRHLIYFPFGADLTDPARAPVDVEPVVLATEDGLALAAWHLAPAGGSPRGSVLVFPGNAGSRADRLPLARGLVARGFAVLLTDYRGYAGNPGRPSEAGLAADARAARAYLLSRAGVQGGRMAYFGESLGTGVAVGLAAASPPAALVLRSPFTSLVAVGRIHYPFLPVSVLLKDRYPSRERIATIGSPLLVLAGGADRVVPASQSRELFEASPAKSKTYHEFPGVDHNDSLLADGGAMLGRVEAFLVEHLH